MGAVVHRALVPSYALNLPATPGTEFSNNHRFSSWESPVFQLKWERMDGIRREYAALLSEVKQASLALGRRSERSRRRVAAEVGSGTGAVVYRMPLGCVRRFRLRARLEVPSLRLRPPPHRTGQADFPHPAHREGVFHRGYASVQLGHAFALQYTTR